MNPDEYLPRLDTVEDCRVVVEACESGEFVQSRAVPMYRTKLGHIQQSAYRDAKHRVLAANLDAQDEGRQRRGRKEDHYYGLLIDIAQEVGPGKADGRRVEMAARYTAQTGLRISKGNNRLKWLEKVSRQIGAE